VVKKDKVRYGRELIATKETESASAHRIKSSRARGAKKVSSLTLPTPSRPVKEVLQST